LIITVNLNKLIICLENTSIWLIIHRKNYLISLFSVQRVIVHNFFWGSKDHTNSLGNSSVSDRQLDLEIFRTIASFIKISSGHSLIIKLFFIKFFRTIREISGQMSGGRCLAESIGSPFWGGHSAESMSYFYTPRVV
jgi:hypothetical protein